MPFSFRKKPSPPHNPHGSWRDYQASLSCRYNRKPRRQRRPTLRPLLFGLLFLVTTFGLFSVIGSAGGPPTPPESPLSASTPTPEATATAAAPAVPLPTVDGPLDRPQLRQLLDEELFSNLTDKDLALPVEGGTIRIETTLDPALQNYLLASIDRKNSRHVGIVVMEAGSGRVLALAGFDRTDAASNPCLRSEFPAASIFKIVTAAAAVDQCGYSADSPVRYNGAKHTLYKRQLTERVDRHTVTIPLAEAFADSINPVFGKLGELHLGKPRLEQAAATFGFNQSLDADVTLPPSQFEIGDTPYNWAEIASGFNRRTTLSPLHGAALTAAILNGGRMAPQTLVERITDDQGEILYRRTPAQSRSIMSPRAAAALEQMMETTITSGTARKAFRGHEKDRVLAELQIGGKTGSISNSARDVRYDWFVGFAKERQGQKQMVVAVMVGHEEFIGTRAGEYARRAMTYYFSQPAPSSVEAQANGTTTARTAPPSASRPI